MRLVAHIKKIIYPALALLLLVSCEDFFEPTPQTVIKEEDFFADWADFRSAEMGLYAVQQELVEQMVILGELRADLLTITPFADADLLEIYNFEISANNKYASPVNFYKLIANCNKLLAKIRQRQPSVRDMEDVNITNYDRLHASVLSMRAWAYFNAVRIYGKVPYVPDFVINIDDIKDYVNTGIVVIDEEMIRFGLTPGASGGISYADTIKDSTIVLDKVWLDMYAIVDTFATQLETEVKTEGSGVDEKPVIGVDYNIEGVNDNTWEVTTWNQYAYHCLLGQMYLTYDDLFQAEKHFKKIVYFSTNNSSEVKRYLLADNAPNWRNFFAGINTFEHIYVIDFNKSERQQNDLQSLFSPFQGSQYMLKPTKYAVNLWEGGERVGWRVNTRGTPSVFTDDIVSNIGRAGDWARGNLASYSYNKNGVLISDTELKYLFNLREEGKDAEVFNFMQDVDTFVSKFSINADVFDKDADFPVYRAAGIHLYMSEVYHRLRREGQIEGTYGTTGSNILFSGDRTYFNQSKGVRGRLDLEKINIPGETNVYYNINPHTGEIDGFKVFPNLASKRDAFEDYIITERARELAFEGERFYDIMRIADRRNDPAYLADKISSKYAGGQRAAIRAKLMDRNNWFVPFDLGIDVD